MSGNNISMKKSPKTLFILLLLISSVVYGKFDLGGECLSIDDPDHSAKSKNIKTNDNTSKSVTSDDIGIQTEKISVRRGCDVEYRWLKLIKEYISAKRFGEAIEILESVETDEKFKKYKVSFAHATLKKLDENFINSTEFVNSSYGKKFLVTDKKYSKLVEEAKLKYSKMKPSELPPSSYNVPGGCPFECCQLGKWKTRTEVVLLEARNSSKVVAKVLAGSAVEAVDSRVINEPTPYVVLEDKEKLKAGEILILLDHTGEGYGNYWYKGKMNGDVGNMEDGFFRSDVIYDICDLGSKGECWLKKLYPEKKYTDEWWVKIKLSNGKTGWILVESQFDGTDACG